MCLNLNDHQFKTSRYSYRSTYKNPMVNTNQKPTIAIQNPKTNYQKNNQTTREETKTVIEKRATKTTRNLVIQWQ